MRVDYAFSNLLGVMYRQGNLLFNADGTSIYSPVGHRVTRFSLNHSGHSYTFSFESYQPIRCMALSPCGRLLLVVDRKGGATLVNVDNDSVVCRIAFKGEVTCVSFSPDGQLIAVAVDKRVQLWRVPCAERSIFIAFALVKTMSGHIEKINSIDWSFCGQYLVTSGDDMVARVYAVAPKQDGHAIPKLLEGHKHAIVGAFFSQDATRIITVGKDSAAFEWIFDPSSGRLITKPGEAIQHLLSLERDNDSSEHYRPWISDVKFNRELGMLIIGYLNGSFGLFKQGIFEGDPYELVHGLSLSTRSIDSVAVSPNGQWLCFGSGPTGQLLVWEWSSESYILKQSTQQDPRCLAYSPDGSLLATGAADGRIRVWSASHGHCLSVFSENSHTGAIKSLSFSRQGRVLVSAGDDGTVRAWDVARLKSSGGTPFRILTAPDEGLKFSCASIDGAGEIVVAGSASGEIFVWNLRNGQLIDTLFGHEGVIVSLSFDPVGTGRLMSASLDRTVRLWSLFDRDKKMTILEHQSDVLGAVWRPDGREIAATCLSGIVCIWESADLAPDYSLLRTIEVKRDIAEKPLSGAHVRSLSFSLDGQFLFIAGAFPFVGIYDADAKVLLRRFPLSNVKKGQKGDLNESKEARAMATSPHGRQFCVLTAEGVLCFSRDHRMSSLAFDPFDLEVDTTPERICELIADEEFLKALSMACRLNIQALIQRVLEAVPIDQIPLLSRTLHPKYLNQILTSIYNLLEGPRVQFYLQWTSCLLLANQSNLKQEQGVLRLIERRLNELFFVDKQLRLVLEQARLSLLQQSLSELSVETINTIE